MTVPTAPPAVPHLQILGLVVCVLLQAVALTWANLSVRAVMGVGGSCVSDGPYEIARPCPDGAWLIAVAVPVLIVTATISSLLAVDVGAPGLLLPVWALLFGSLGWSFWEFGLFSGAAVPGWIACGVLFWAMALPAVYLWLRACVAALRAGAAGEDGDDAEQHKDAAQQLLWVAMYVTAGLPGVLIGLWSYHAI